VFKVGRFDIGTQGPGHFDGESAAFETALGSFFNYALNLKRFLLGRKSIRLTPFAPGSKF
jgi:hypothetical protein